MASSNGKPFQAVKNPVEQLTDAVSGVAKDIHKEITKPIFDEALMEIGFKPRKPMSGEFNVATGAHKSNQEVIQTESISGRKIQQLRSIQQQEKEVFNLQKSHAQTEIRRVMEQLSVEIKRLQSQTSQLSQEVKTMTVESAPARPGVYYTNFFEWVLMTLRDLRKKVNESRQWLNMWTTKKKQKGYWAMFKKHGTSFAMSDERAVASANG